MSPSSARDPVVISSAAQSQCQGGLSWVRWGAWKGLTPVTNSPFLLHLSLLGVFIWQGYLYSIPHYRNLQPSLLNLFPLLDLSSCCCCCWCCEDPSNNPFLCHVNHHQNVLCVWQMIVAQNTKQCDWWCDALRKTHEKGSTRFDPLTVHNKTKT